MWTCKFGSVAVEMARISVADPETSERGGARNMKYKPSRVAAIFFGPIFYRPGGGLAPLAPPPGSATVYHYNVLFRGVRGCGEGMTCGMNGWD